MLWTGLFTIAASYERLFRAINNKTKFNCSYKWGMCERFSSVEKMRELEILLYFRYTKYYSTKSLID